MTSEQQQANHAPRPLLGALYEGGLAFLVALVVLVLWWIREAIGGKHVLPGGAWPVVVIAVVTGVFFGFAGYRRLRRLRGIQSKQAFRSENDALVATCLAAYEDGLDDVTQRLLAAPDVPVQVERVLEERTWNVHRVIVFLQTTGSSPKPADLKRDLTAWVPGNLHGTWIRGLGLGIVLRSAGIQAELEDLYQAVDGCGGPSVIVQWIVAVDDCRRRVLAVHMPVSGKTTPCFLAMLSHLGGEDYSFEMALKEKTGIYRRLSALDAKIPPWLHAVTVLLH